MFCAVSGLSCGLEYLVRRFYERFAVQRSAFLAQVQGSCPCSARVEYGSLLLNRILFFRFLQAGGFLNNDPQYLSHQLYQTQRETGAQAFYRHFLLRLCHEGVSFPQVPRGDDRLFGRLPYLGSALFPPHPLEDHLHIPDQAFAQLFAFLDEYIWRLDDSFPHSERVITPILLGPVFELYISQREMGAYYTQEDVADYIARNTILAHLLEKLAYICNNGRNKESGIWQLLQKEPERYIPVAQRSEEPLPGEGTREYASRRAYYAGLRTRLVEGELSTVDELITCNLDILQFLTDIIQGIEQPLLLHDWYEQLRQVTILDPTCGSGAFLFAALAVLTPLYKASFARMQVLGLSPAVPLAPHSRYTILKQVLTNNLYGVDIVEEAIELCRLRLVLKLLTCLHDIEDVEPLPALTTHLRVGNALGNFSPARNECEQDSQLTVASSAGEHFSWQGTFADILAQGGFSVIIGNPPYVEYKENDFPYRLRDFATLPCANLYPCVVERCRQLLAPGGWHGMVVPLAAFATRNMQPFLDGFRRWFPCSWVSFYHFRPAMLFAGGKVASIPTAIYVARTEGPERRFSTALLKWTQEQRPRLFSRLSYCRVSVASDPANRHYYPKFGDALENTIMEKILHQRLLRDYLAGGQNENRLFYRSAGGLYWKVFVNFPWPYLSSSNKHCSFQEGYLRDVLVAVLNSSLFWWYYTVTFDSFNLKDYMLFGFRFTYPSDPVLIGALIERCHALMADFQYHARHLKRGTTNSYTIYARKSKAIIDEIDRLLSRHYGFTDAELNFILHYDEQYRLGKAGDEE